MKRGHLKKLNLKEKISLAIGATALVSALWKFVLIINDAQDAIESNKRAVRANHIRIEKLESNAVSSRYIDDRLNRIENKVDTILLHKHQV